MIQGSTSCVSFVARWAGVYCLTSLIVSEPGLVPIVLVHDLISINRSFRFRCITYSSINHLVFIIVGHLSLFLLF